MSKLGVVLGVLGGAAAVGGGIYAYSRYKASKAPSSSVLPPLGATPRMTSPGSSLPALPPGDVYPDGRFLPPGTTAPPLLPPQQGYGETPESPDTGPTSSIFAIRPDLMKPPAPSGSAPSAYGISPLGPPTTDLQTKAGVPLYQRGVDLFTPDNKPFVSSPTNTINMVVESQRTDAHGKTIGTRDVFEIYLKNGRRYHKNGIPVIMGAPIQASPLFYNPLATFTPPGLPGISGMRRDGTDVMRSGARR